MKKYKSQIIKYIIEILVIVIGILGAFALDSWKQGRESENLEHEVLKQIHEDLIVILADLKDDFIIHDIALQSHFNLENVIKNNLNYNDSLTFDFYWIKEDEYIFPNKTGYEKLEAYGTNLVTDQNIRTYISYVYNHDFPRITKGNNLYPDINEYLTPYYQKNFKINNDPALKYTLTLTNNFIINYPRHTQIGQFSDLQFIGLTPIDFSKTINDNEFKYLLSETKRYRIYKYRMYKNTISRVEKLIGMIEEYN